MIIRTATLSDCAAISAIYNHYVLHDTCTYQDEPEQLEDREKMVCGAWSTASGDRG